MSAPPRQPAPEPRPVIRRGEVYPWREFRRLMNWQEHAARQARLAGLPTVLFGRERYVIGDSAVAWFARLEAEQAGQLIQDRDRPDCSAAKTV